MHNCEIYQFDKNLNTKTIDKTTGLNMTICIAIKCHDDNNKDIPVVLFAADTQESSAYTKSSASKLKLILDLNPNPKKRNWEFVVASSGDALVADEAINEISYFLADKISSKDNPSVALMSLRGEIGDIAFKTYDKYKKREADNPEFSLLFGAADKFSTILFVNYDGRNRELERIGFIGSGRVTGGELILSEFLKEDELTECEAACLASLVISTVGHVDMFVGGTPDMYVCRQRQALEFDAKYYSNEILQKSELRWNLLKKLWQKMLEDESFENKLKNLLKE